MKRFLGAVIGLIAACALHAAEAETVAFVNVTVVPMDAERMLQRHTVVVRGDRIVNVGPVGAVKVPEGARRIDGAGKFLMPGLAEMHGHFPPGGSAREFVENVAFLYVANGVTTVRSMLGSPGQLEYREAARRGEFVSPWLTMAGPSFSGQSVRTAEKAAARVRAQKAEGWDLLKVHPGVKPEVYAAMAKTAKEVGMEFSGHVPAEVGIVSALEQGQRTIDHLDGYIEWLQGQTTPLSAEKAAEAVKLTRKHNAWVVPTMVLWETIIGAAKTEELAAFPELKYMPRAMVAGWKESYARRIGGANFNAAQAARVAANRKVLLKAFADGGVRILFGTDSPQQFSVPGFSTHREMQAMKAAGMSNFAILQSATKAVGEYEKARDAFGVVAKGQRADLLLLTADPLANLTAVAQRAGVMVRGKWIPEAEIQARLEKIAESAVK